jgi:5-methylcytosine-specific restriction endonuclease McrA
MASELPPLACGCKATKCKSTVPMDKRRHAFIAPTRAGVLPGIGGSCMSCGKPDLVDWERCHQNDLADIDALIDNLRLELVRDNYWGLALPEHVIRKARKRTSAQLKTTIDRVLRDALPVDNWREGWQTPWSTPEGGGSIVTSAQHATGTCCRECLEKWHGYPFDSELTAGQFRYLAQLGWAYTEQRLELASVGGEG